MRASLTTNTAETETAEAEPDAEAVAAAPMESDDLLGLKTIFKEEPQEAQAAAMESAAKRKQS